MKVLGVSADYHDSAGALLVDGRPFAAAQEDRFSRVKHDAALPLQALEFCLRRGGISPTDLDAVVFCDKPILKFDRLLTTMLDRAPRGWELSLLAMAPWLKEKLWVPGPDLHDHRGLPPPLRGPPRRPGGPVEQRHLDLAASVQEAAERFPLDLARRVAEKTGDRNLCLAGGGGAELRRKRPSVERGAVRAGVDPARRR